MDSSKSLCFLLKQSQTNRIPFLEIKPYHWQHFHFCKLNINCVYHELLAHDSEQDWVLDDEGLESKSLELGVGGAENVAITCTRLIT